MTDTMTAADPDAGWPRPLVRIVRLDRRTAERYRRRPDAGLLRLWEHPKSQRRRPTNPTCTMLCAPGPDARQWLRTVAHPTTTVRRETATDRTEPLRRQRATALQRCTEDRNGANSAELELSTHWLPDAGDRARLEAAIQAAVARDLGPDVRLPWDALDSIGHHHTRLDAPRALIEQLCEAPESTFAATAGIHLIDIAHYVEFHGMFE